LELNMTVFGTKMVIFRSKTVIFELQNRPPQPWYIREDHGSRLRDWARAKGP